MKIGNVLSLFDGMSCGQIALNKLNFEYDNYYASEINSSAIKVTMSNYPNTKQIGSITEVSGSDLPNIDLLIGGSSCQNFSFAGNRVGMSTEDNIEITSLEQYNELKNNGFKFKGESYLFWEYVRLLNEIKPKYFLLENVKMSKKWQIIITNALGVEPILINSSLVSAQNRPRLYWTNIPDVEQPKDRDIQFKDIINNEYEFKPLTNWFFSKWGDKRKIDSLRTINANKSFCVTTNKSHSKNYYLSDDKTMARMLERDEVERLQTVPNGYTDSVTKTEAHKMLGNGWTVDVISHIFSYIK
jgi:site-specific DNA-cytosine methylase